MQVEYVGIFPKEFYIVSKGNSVAVILEHSDMEKYMNGICCCISKSFIQRIL